MNNKKDVFLPGWVLGLGIFLLLVAAGCVVLGVIHSAYFLLGAVVCLALGIAAILCWKNQWVEMVSDREFLSSTMFGHQSRHSFSEIRGVKQNTDSFVLLLDSQRVHIESCAVVSDRFGEALNQRLGNDSPYHI